MSTLKKIAIKVCFINFRLICICWLIVCIFYFLHHIRSIDIPRFLRVAVIGTPIEQVHKAYPFRLCGRVQEGFINSKTHFRDIYSGGSIASADKEYSFVPFLDAQINNVFPDAVRYEFFIIAMGTLGYVVLTNSEEKICAVLWRST